MSDFAKVMKQFFTYSVMTSDINDIREGDLVGISFHYKNAFVCLGEKGKFYSSIKSVKDATIKKSEKAVLIWSSTLGRFAPEGKFLETSLNLLEEKKTYLEKKYKDGSGDADPEFEMFAVHVCVRQYHFGHAPDKQNGVWFNIMRTQEQIDKLKALDDVKKSKKQEKRQRQKEAKKQEEQKKRLFVRIRVPQPGGMCHEGRQVVKSWDMDIKPSFYEEIGWFDM